MGGICRLCVWFSCYNGEEIFYPPAFPLPDHIPKDQYSSYIFKLKNHAKKTGVCVSFKHFKKVV